MNSKLMKAGIAGAAVVALAAGGGTFASWSDFGQFNNNVAAGILKLDLTPNTQNPGDDLKFDNVAIAPGSIYQERQVYIASSDGKSVPNSKLFVSLLNLVGHENGCDTNSEASAELGAETVASDPTAPCNMNAGDAGTNQGQLIHQATMSVSSYAANSPTDCTYSNAPAGKTITRTQGWTLDQWTANNHHELTGANHATDPATFVDVPTLAPGQGLCVALVLALPSTNTAGINLGNSAQGDKASFDIRFDLEQA